jgi:acyl-homoserine-lactone acylase
VLSPWGALASASLEPGPDPLGAVAPDRAATTGIAAGGYRVTYGASFVMAVELTDEGPKGVGLLAYGQCGDDRSPHHVDGTRAYSARQVRPLLFDEADIAADPNLRQQTVTG